MYSQVATQPLYLINMGKNLLENISKRNPRLIEGVVRDSELQPVEQFICNLYVNPELQTVD